MNIFVKSVLTGVLAGAALVSAHAQSGGVLNIYSARHYQTDEALYSNFTKQTGIKINRLDGRAEELLERIRNEGANKPADVATYESLSSTKLKGLICVRSGMHPYNLSLVASLVAHNGEAATEQWA